MKVIVTGGRGLIGSKFMKAYANQYELVQLGASHETRVDITDSQALSSALNQHPDAQALIHLAAYTDVNGAFAQTDDKDGPAWKVNVVGTKNIADACAERGLYLIHVSTAYVFDGNKPAPYTELDAPKPIEWYGLTKYESEKAVQVSGAKAVILRIDQPFSREASPKVDTLWRIITGLRNGNLYPQFTNHYFGPTYIEDFIKVLDFCLRQQITGVYHASSGESWSDFDFASLVKTTLGLDGVIQKGDLGAYLRTLERPYQKNTAMDNSQLKAILDFPLLSIKEAVAQTKLF
ncbi:NAD(P)-dependent oxidoreductase [bacterium]|nr:NAD(P)-dependent oxidoreductase [bacterium]